MWHFTLQIAICYTLLLNVSGSHLMFLFLIQKLPTFGVKVYVYTFKYIIFPQLKKLSFKYWDNISYHPKL